jgi:hypothetical protein
LGKSAPETDQQREAGCGETTQDRILEPEHPLTHKIPELLPAGILARPSMPFKWVSIAAETHRIPMADNLDFVQQHRNYIALW